MFNWERKGLNVSEEVLFLPRMSDLILQFTLSSCSGMAYAPAQNLLWCHLKLLVKLLLLHSPAPQKSADKHQDCQSFIFFVTKKTFWDQNAVFRFSPASVSLRSTITLIPVIQPHKWFVIEGSLSGVKVSTQDRLAESYKTLQVQLNMWFIFEALI